MCCVQRRCGSACQECLAFMPDAGVSLSAVALLWLLGAKIRYYLPYQVHLWYPRLIFVVARRLNAAVAIVPKPMRMLLLLRLLQSYPVHRSAAATKLTSGIIPHRVFVLLPVRGSLVTAIGQFTAAVHARSLRTNSKNVKVSHLRKVDLHRVIGRRHGRRNQSTTKARFALSCAFDDPHPFASPVLRDGKLTPESL